jgi:hypothetical protein
MDVADAIEELHRCSFIELPESPEERHLFVSIPLVASLFGRRKLAVSPSRKAIEEDTSFLQLFGAMQASDVRHGVGPRVTRFVKSLAELISREKTALDKNVPMLEFVARAYPSAWLLIADLYEEVGGANAAEMAMNAVERFLESTPRDNRQLVGWERKVLLCRRSGDLRSAVHSLSQICELPKVGLHAISDAANTLNSIILNPDLKLDWNEKTAVVNRVIAAMKGYISEVDATDCSRLAWLYMRIGDHECARGLTQQGLVLDPTNEYCLRLEQRLF